MKALTKRGVEVGRYPDFSRTTTDHQLTMARTPEQHAALYYSKEGHTILITGQCGTGKTFALKYDFHYHIYNFHTA